MWQKKRDTIGQNRTWVLGRVFGGIWFLTVGLLFLGVGVVLALIYAVVDAVYALILNRPLNIGRSLAYAPISYALAWGLYVLGAKSYPGLIPRREHGRRN